MSNLETLASYPHLTDWVRAQPSGLAHLVVVSDQEFASGLHGEEWKAQLDLHAVAAESELDWIFRFNAEEHFASVWLSRCVSPESEAKVPRGVKAYREKS